MVSLAGCDADRDLRRAEFACGLGGPCDGPADGEGGNTQHWDGGSGLPPWDGVIFGDLYGGDPDDAGAAADGAPTDDDVGVVDAGHDAGLPDLPPKDAGTPDAGPQDAGPPDTGPPDAGPPDAGPPDAGPPDAGLPDAGPPDAGLPDAGPPDAGPPDSGPTDAGPPDAGPPDAGPPDAGPPDAADGGITPPCAADPSICDDANTCTKDLCDPKVGCMHVPAAAKCTTACDPWAKCVAGVCVAGQPAVFEVAVGGPGNQWGGDLLEQADGTLLIAGHVAGAGDSIHLALMRLSAKGQFMGQTTLSGSGKSQAKAMVGLKDGASIIAGDNDHDLDGVWRGTLLKVSSGGGPMWQKTYSGSGDSRFADVASHSDGAISVVGRTQGAGTAAGQAWLLRVVGFGSVKHQLVLGGVGDDTIYGVAADGAAALAVGARAAGKGSDGWLLRVDGKGKVAWQQYIAGPGKRVARQVAARPGGGWLVAGQLESAGASGWDAWMLATDALGNSQWLRSWQLPGSQLPWGLAATADGGWLLAGTQIDPAGDSDGWLLRTDGLGKALWQRSYGGAGTQRGMAVRALADQGIALLGLSFDAGAQADVWLVRSDAWGEVDCK